MSDDLFSAPTRARLEAAGCQETGGLVGGEYRWRLPSGDVVSRQEAERWLERREAEEKSE